MKCQPVVNPYAIRVAGYCRFCPRVSGPSTSLINKVLYSTSHNVPYWPILAFSPLIYGICHAEGRHTCRTWHQANAALYSRCLQKHQGCASWPLGETQSKSVSRNPDGKGVGSVTKNCCYNILEATGGHSRRCNDSASPPGEDAMETRSAAS